MKQKLCILFYLFVFFDLSFAIEKLPIFPYEIDGKKGFVNTKFEIITKPEFNCDEWDYYDAEYSKYAARSTIIKDGVKFWYIILYNGKKISIPSGNGYVSGLIGDDYYFENFNTQKNGKTTEYSIITSLWDSNETYTLENTIRYGYSREWIVESRVKESRYGDRIINLKGEVKWFSPERQTVHGIYPDADLIFIMPNTYSTKMIDLSGKKINDCTWATLIGGYSNGLFACGKYINDGKEIEIGFYNRDGERIIPLTLLPGEFANSTFYCNVAPLIYENGNFTIYTGVGKDSDNWVIVNTKGNIIVRNISAFEISNFCKEGSAILKKKSNEGKKQILIKVDGQPLNSNEYDWIKEPVNGYYRARRNETDYVICAKTGKEYKCKDF